MNYALNPLPYPYDGLQPLMSESTLQYHHGKHLKAYLDKVGELTAEQKEWNGASLADLVMKSQGTLLNNAAQAWNHIFFFAQLSASPHLMSADMDQRLTSAFGGTDDFIRLFTQHALGLFGSGWVWLSLTPEGALQITAEANAGNPMRNGWHPLMCIDVWEHAYYLDHQNRRADYLDAFWKLLDWNVVESRLKDVVTHPIYY